MADAADAAQRIDEDARERALATRLAGMHTRGCGTTCCIVCGDPIPVARRLAVQNCRTCVECQQGLDAEAAWRRA